MIFERHIMYNSKHREPYYYHTSTTEGIDDILLAFLLLSLKLNNLKVGTQTRV